MYPKLLKNWKIKGCVDNYFLMAIDSFNEFSLNNFQVNTLLLCDGKENIETICRKMNVDRENLTAFLCDMENMGALKINNLASNSGNRFNNFKKIKFPYLKEVHLDITSRCNLRCLHCYQEPYLTNETPEMTMEEIKNLISQLAEMNISKIVISGGEPFLRNDLMQITDFAFRKGIIVPTIFTNGTINNGTLESLCSYGKPFTLAISLEGDSEEVNDYIRGRSSFNKIIKSLKIILTAQNNGSKVKTVIDTMIHPKNYKRLKEMFLFLSELGMQRWRVSLPRNQGAYTINFQKLNVEYKKVLEEYEKFIMWYLKEGIKISNLDIQIESVFRTALIKRKEMSVFTSNSCCCEYKREALAIKPNGDVMACTAFTNLVIGNVKEEPINDIWHSSKMQNVKRIKVVEVEECKDCEYLYLCGTGCRRMALADKGSIKSKDESICEIYKFFHNRIMPILSSLELELKQIS